MIAGIKAREETHEIAAMKVSKHLRFPFEITANSRVNDVNRSMGW
jgi:hypothetical protein